MLDQKGMKKGVGIPTHGEVEASLSWAEMTQDLKVQEKYKEALAEGYKDEKCLKCGTVFLAHDHIVMCDDSECPVNYRYLPFVGENRPLVTEEVKAG
jgi:hypothetical protein